MSRAAVYDAIVNDPQLISLGFTTSNVLVNYDADQRPTDLTDDGMFIVIRWGEHEIDPIIKRGPRRFEVWVHILRENTTDYGHLDKVINILDGVLEDIIDTPGGDGYSVTVIEGEGHSEDFRDEVYQTLTRSASYRMISRVTA